jgi:hypothetical protein
VYLSFCRVHDVKLELASLFTTTFTSREKDEPCYVDCSFCPKL